MVFTPTNSPNFADVLTVSEAAQYLGVSTATLRNWDRSGKLTPRRHPQNGYRIYLHEDLEAVLRSADLSTLTDESFAPQVDWSEIRDSDHFVQFYENDEYLVESVCEFVAAALNDGQSSIIVATEEHRNAIGRRLLACGVDVPGARQAERFVVLDAADTLSKFMRGGSPDPQLFADTVGTAIATLAQTGCRIHAFGEMVALLWADGNQQAAIQLEQLWNDLGTRYRFALFCAYPINGFDDESHAAPFNGICDSHTRVIPAESYTTQQSADDRLRVISVLQQKAQSLETEIAHRRQVENVLTQRERELSRLVGDLLDDRQITRDKIEPRKEPVESAAIKDAVGTTRPLVVSAAHESATMVPAAPALVDAQQPARSSHAGALRILVVDDNHDSSYTLGLLLGVRGHEVRTARDGLEAVEIAQAFEPEVILMDIGMPKLNGYEATRRIRELPCGQDVFIVALTGWGREQDIQQSVEAGCSAHLVKPVELPALERLLATSSVSKG
jgi:excisionase family DNA binding protein